MTLALLPPQTRRSPAIAAVRVLHILRHMNPPRADDHARPGPPMVEWGVVVTNAIGALLGLLIAGGVGGVSFLVWRLPTQQDQILKNQAAVQQSLNGISNELKQLEQNDRVQDNRLTRIEAGK